MSYTLVQWRMCWLLIWLSTTAAYTNVSYNEYKCTVIDTRCRLQWISGGGARGCARQENESLVGRCHTQYISSAIFILNLE